MAVIVTPTAAREICQIIRQQELDPEKIRLRVGVKGGGCSGFSYLLDLTETQRETDELWEVDYEFPAAGGRAADGNGDSGASGGVSTASGTHTFTLRIVCDPKSYLYLDGTTIDFKDEVMGRGFVFNNPKATSTCGCGSSFSA